MRRGRAFAWIALVAISCGGNATEEHASSSALAVSHHDASPSIAAFGTLALTVKTPDGKPWTDACTAVAIPIAGGFTREITEALQRGPSIEAELPPGRWRIHVDSQEALPACCMKTPDLSRCGDREVECEIKNGETTALAVRLRAGGRVSLALALPDELENAEISSLRALPECDRRERVVELADGKHESACAIVSVFGRDGAPARRMSFLAPCCTRLAVDRAVLGLSSLSETFFDPGPLSLRIEAPGFEPSTVEATIESGRNTDVRVALRPIVAK